MESGIQHYLSVAPAFKEEDDDRNVSTKARTTINGSKKRKEAQISINDLLPTGTIDLNMARSFRNFRKHP